MYSGIVLESHPLADRLTAAGCAGMRVQSFAPGAEAKVEDDLKTE